MRFPTRPPLRPKPSKSSGVYHWRIRYQEPDGSHWMCYTFGPSRGKQLPEETFHIRFNSPKWRGYAGWDPERNRFFVDGIGKPTRQVYGQSTFAKRMWRKQLGIC